MPCRCLAAGRRKCVRQVAARAVCVRALGPGGWRSRLAGVASLLRLYTDFVCPFCFIAEQSTVPRLLKELDLTLDWYGFELHPSTPPGGVPLSRLFPGTPLPALHERTKRFGASFGVLNFQPPDWLTNSR